MTEQAHASTYFVPRPIHWITGALGCTALALVALGYCAWIARGPDRTLTFSRDALSHRAPAEIARQIGSLGQWKNWFFMLADAQAVDSQGHPLPKSLQTAREGELVRFLIDPKKDESHRFEIVGRITRYEPGRLLEIELLDDSAGKIFSSFDRLQWRIEISPAGAGAPGTIIHGTELAHTASWRSRVLAGIAQRILMSQLFYPNLIQLADPSATVKPDGR